MRKAAAAAMAMTLLFGMVNAQSVRSADEEILTPIIAQLYAEPAVYAGRPISIYGLVIEAAAGGTVFMLQDVSQHPLRIVGNALMKAAPGDQLTIVGTLRRDAGGLYVAATLTIPTRIVGGGGCC
jgi:hypothetical protein